MRAYQITKEGGPVECREVEKPTPKDHEVLAKTLVTGVCHTDVHVIDGDLGRVSVPLTPGHEGVGKVVAVGPAVKRINVGDRIGVSWLGHSCLACSLCKAGRENLCPHQRQTGFRRDGSFSEYFVVDERFASKIPSNLSSAEAAPILCAGVTAYRAIRMASAPEGARIIIIGACGGLGHLGVQYAKGMGYQVVALDLMDDTKRQWMKDLGADFVVDSASHEEASSLSEQFQQLPDGAQHAIAAAVVFSPITQAVSDAVDYVAPGGTIVCVGLPKGHFEIDVTSFILKELELRGSIVGTPRDVEEALTIASRGGVRAHVDVREFEALPDVLKELKAGQVQGRVVVQVAEEDAT